MTLVICLLSVVRKLYGRTDGNAWAAIDSSPVTQVWVFLEKETKLEKLKKNDKFKKIKNLKKIKNARNGDFLAQKSYEYAVE